MCGGGRGGADGGYDCSNLTSCAYETVGVTISGNDQDQYEDPKFEHVSLDQAVPGDILWKQRTCWNVHWRKRICACSLSRRVY